VANPSAAQKLLNSRQVVTLLDTEVGAKHWEIGVRVAGAGGCHGTFVPVCGRYPVDAHRLHSTVISARRAIPP
jgi:hypothetical protein